jgi:hypothetical protein
VACPSIAVALLENASMPFDGADFDGSRDLQLIDAVIALVRGEPDDAKASILGAMRAVGAEAELKRYIRRAIRELTGRYYRRIDTFDYAPITTRALAIEVLYRTRHQILAEIADRVIGPPNAAGSSWLARLGLVAWLRRSFA